MLLTPAAVDEPEILDLQPLDDEDDRPAPRRAPIDMTGAPPGAPAESKSSPLFTSKAAKLDDVSDFGEVDASADIDTVRSLVHQVADRLKPAA